MTTPHTFTYKHLLYIFSDYKSFGYKPAGLQIRLNEGIVIMLLFDYQLGSCLKVYYFFEYSRLTIPAHMQVKNKRIQQLKILSFTLQITLS